MKRRDFSCVTEEVFGLVSKQVLPGPRIEMRNQLSNRVFDLASGGLWISLHRSLLPGAQQGPLNMALFTTHLESKNHEKAAIILGIRTLTDTSASGDGAPSLTSASRVSVGGPSILAVGPSDSNSCGQSNTLHSCDYNGSVA